MSQSEIKSKNPVVTFLLEDMDVEVPRGSQFLDVVDAAGADVTFGCRNGTCGTCRIHIESGSENLSAVNTEERDFLQSIEAGPQERLGCQVRILGDCSVNYVGL